MGWERVLSMGAVAALMCAPSAPAQSALPSLLDQPASAAVIEMAGNTLTIHATNSSLRAILDDLATRTGSKVEGLTKDERIFGVYGPGKPDDVLASLLDDSGYNVLIAGRRPDGAPREIVLSTREAAPANGTQSAPTQAAAEDDDGEGYEGAPPPQPAFFGQLAQPANPVNPAAQAQPGTPQPQVKTPQQMLEELQRMRQVQAAQQAQRPQ